MLKYAESDLHCVILTATDYIKKNNKKQAKDFIPLHKIFHPMHTVQRKFCLREEPSGMWCCMPQSQHWGGLGRRTSLGYARSQLTKPKQ